MFGVVPCGVLFVGITHASAWSRHRANVLSLSRQFRANDILSHSHCSTMNMLCELRISRIAYIDEQMLSVDMYIYIYV